MRLKRIVIFALVFNFQMKHFLLALFLLSTTLVSAQVNIVVSPSDTTVCYRDSLSFRTLITGSGTGKLTYRWQKNFIDLSGPGSSDSLLAIDPVDANSPGVYRCIVTAEGVGSDTSNEVILRMYPRMFIDTLFRYNDLGCLLKLDNGKYKRNCIGQYAARVSGGTPFSGDRKYIYQWNAPGFSQDTLIFGLCPGKYKFRVTDSVGCSIDSAYLVDFLHSPKGSFEIKPDTVIYLTKPSFTLSFPDTLLSKITNWTWNFGDSTTAANINPVSHTYDDTLKEGQVKLRLTVTDHNGCDTTYTRMITLNPAELDIPNLITPNGDFANDKFAIELTDDRERDFRDAFITNELVVFDRWGKKVFSAENYKSEDWDGERLSDGTYFYVLKLTAQTGTYLRKGSVTIIRGK